MAHPDRLSLHMLSPRPGVLTVREATWTPIVAGLGVLAALLAGLGGKFVHRKLTAGKSRNADVEPLENSPIDQPKNDEKGEKA